MMNLQRTCREFYKNVGEKNPNKQQPHDFKYAVYAVQLDKFIQPCAAVKYDDLQTVIELKN